MPRNVIRAIVTTNSSEDDYNRVQVKCEGIWDESNGSPLIESVGSIPLIKDDVVYIDISDGYEHPLILGRSQDKSAKHSIDSIEGSILFDSSDGDKWTVCYVKNDKLYMENSEGVKTTFEEGKVTVEHDDYTFKLEDGKKITISNSDKSQFVIDGTDVELTNSKVKVKISGTELEVSSATKVKINGDGHSAPWGDKMVEHLGNLYGFINTIATAITTAATGVVTPVGPGTIPNFAVTGPQLTVEVATKKALCTEQLTCSQKTKLD